MQETYLYFDTDYIEDFKHCKTDKEKVFANRLKKDKRYLDYYHNVRSIKSLYDAGFFIENEDLDFDDFNDYFPTSKYLAKFKEGAENVVLLTCGAFSPLHIGHIEMLNIAKKELEDRNYNVCGGIISPSHDMYVSTKRNGEADMFILDRVNEAERIIKETHNEWLSVDMWEGLYTTQSLNFTSVFDRLSRVLNSTDKEIKVVFVFGSDNHDFRYVFGKDELVICVDRGNRCFNINKELEQHKLNIVLNGNDVNENISSTNVRSSGYIMPTVKTSNYYELRNDSYESSKYLGVTKEMAEKISCRLVNCLHKYVIDKPEILNINLENQIEISKEFIDNVDYKTISLDVYIKGDYNVSVSREFDYLSGQVSSKGIVNRLGKPLSKVDVPSGDYLLIDDDIASGFTSQQIINKLPKDAVIKGCHGLNSLVRDENKVAFDIVDARDFIIGSEYGGLQVSVGNDIIRVPYLFPYVNLFYRANICSDKQVQFTKEILELNLEVFKELDNIKVSDLKENKNWLLYMNYKEDDFMVDVITKELEKINKF